VNREKGGRPHGGKGRGNCGEEKNSNVMKGLDERTRWGGATYAGGRPQLESGKIISWIRRERLVRVESKKLDRYGKIHRELTITLQKQRVPSTLKRKKNCDNANICKKKRLLSLGDSDRRRCLKEAVFYAWFGGLGRKEEDSTDLRSKTSLTSLGANRG